MIVILYNGKALNVNFFNTDTDDEYKHFDVCRKKTFKVHLLLNSSELSIRFLMIIIQFLNRFSFSFTKQ